MIFAHSDIVTRIMLCATLTNDDVACDDCLSTENFHSESFAVRLTTVFGTTNAFLVCHNSLNFFGLLFSDIFNAHLAQILTVAVESLITFSSFLLENKNLVCSQMLDNLSIYLGTFEDGGAYPCAAVIVDQQHLVEADSAVDIAIQAVAEDFISLAHFELLPCYFYDCVH